MSNVYRVGQVYLKLQVCLLFTAHCRNPMNISYSNIFRWVLWSATNRLTHAAFTSTLSDAKSAKLANMFTDNLLNAHF